jgi:hypothetical protein
LGVVKSTVDGVHGESFFLGTVFTRLHNRVRTIAGAHAARAIAVDPTTNIFYIWERFWLWDYCSGGYTVINRATDQSSPNVVIANSSLDAVAVNSGTNKIYFATVIADTGVDLNL